MRQVKCRNCGTFIDKDKAVIVQNGKTKAFYCNENCMKSAQEREIAAQKEKEEKERVYRLICDIIEREEIINGILWKEWALWNKVANNKKIRQYLEENKDYLCGIVSKLEDKEFNRIRYLSAVLKNKLGDYKPKAKEEERLQQDKSIQTESSFEFFEPTRTQIQQPDKQILCDVEDDLL